MKKNDRLFADIYDQYSPIVYDIASQNCDTKAEADQVTLQIFQQVHIQGMVNLNRNCLGATLIRLAILSINEHIRTKEFVMKQFENQPLIQQILSAGPKIKAISERSELTTTQIRKMIRAEFNSIRKTKKLPENDKSLSFT